MNERKVAGRDSEANDLSTRLNDFVVGAATIVRVGRQLMCAGQSLSARPRSADGFGRMQTSDGLALPSRELCQDSGIRGSFFDIKDFAAREELIGRELRISRK